MLNKLLKHEFRAAGRVLLPLLGALLLLSVMAGVSYRIMDSQWQIYWVFKAILTLVQGVFFLSLFAACVLVAVMIVLRFYKSLMGDEGYLSFTLPVTADGHLWAKLITSLVWLAAAAIVCFAAMAIFFAIGDGRSVIKILHFSGFFRDCVRVMGIGNTVGFTAEGLIGIVLLCLCPCLHVYAAIALGCTADKNKKLLSVVWYFLLAIARNAVLLSLVPILTARSVWQWLSFHASFDTFTEAIPALHITASAGCFALAALCAAYYLLARFCMTKKLNLA